MAGAWRTGARLPAVTSSVGRLRVWRGNGIWRGEGERSIGPAEETPIAAWTSWLRFRGDVVGSDHAA